MNYFQIKTLCKLYKRFFSVNLLSRGFPKIARDQKPALTLIASQIFCLSIDLPLFVDKINYAITFPHFQAIKFVKVYFLVSFSRYITYVLIPAAY